MWLYSNQKDLLFSRPPYKNLFAKYRPESSWGGISGHMEDFVQYQYHLKP